jgi:hypothetical protein
MGIEVAPHRFGRINVAIADSDGEMECSDPFVESDPPDHFTAPDPIARRHDPIGKVRV